MSAARTGLWHAACRFDPARNVTFEAFAKRRVAGAIIDALRAEHVATYARKKRSPGLVAMLAACSYAPKPEEFHDAEDIAWLASWRCTGTRGDAPLQPPVISAIATVINPSLPVLMFVSSWPLRLRRLVLLFAAAQTCRSSCRHGDPGDRLTKSDGVRARRGSAY